MLSLPLLSPSTIHPRCKAPHPRPRCCLPCFACFLLSACCFSFLTLSAYSSQSSRFHEDTHECAERIVIILDRAAVIVAVTTAVGLHCRALRSAFGWRCFSSFVCVHARVCLCWSTSHCVIGSVDLIKKARSIGRSGNALLHMNAPLSLATRTPADVRSCEGSRIRWHLEYRLQLP